METSKSKGKGGAKRKQYQSRYHETKARVKEARRPEIVELWCKGWTHAQIAEHFKLSPGRISQEIIEMRREWRAEFLHAVETMQAEEVRRVLNLEKTYWREFDKSCKKRIYPKGTDGSINYDAPESEIKVVEVLGNPELLAGIRGCIELRAKILGLGKDTHNTQVNVFTVDQVAKAVVEARQAEQTDRLAQVERLMMDVGDDGIARLSEAALGAAQAGRGQPGVPGGAANRAAEPQGGGDGDQAE